MNVSEDCAVKGEPQKIEIKKTEKGLSWTDSEGKLHEYERPIRTMYIQVQNLKAIQSFSSFMCNEFIEPKDEKCEYTPLVLSFHGNAILEDHGIELIGYPDTNRRMLDVDFKLIPDGDVRIEEGKPVALGFTPPDWEIGNLGGWWVSIYLTPQQFNALAQAINTHQLSKLTIGVQLDDLYVTEWYAVPRDRINWYMPPDSDSALPSKLARGLINVFAFETTALILSSPIFEEPDSISLDYEPEYNPEPDDKISTALETLAAKLSEIRGTLNSIVWAVVIIVFILAFKG